MANIFSGGDGVATPGVSEQVKTNLKQIETYVIPFGGSDIVVTFTPDSTNTFKPEDVGGVEISYGGGTTASRYKRPTFIPVPFPFTGLYGK